MTFFFYGPNSYALREQVRQMVAAYMAKTGSDMGLERIDGAATKPDSLLAALQAAPFLTTSRLVIIDSVAANKATAAKLADLLDAVPKTTVAVFTEREVDQRTTAFKTLMKADKVVKFEPLAPGQLLAWCKKQVEQLGGTADRAALQALIDTAGEDQWRLEGEITKLVNFEPAITAAAVRELVTPSIDQSIFDLVEAMTAGRTAEALGGYHRMLASRESEIYILTMIQWQLRNLLLAKTAGGRNQAELAKAAGMSPYVAGKMLAAQRRFDEQTLAEAYRAAADCEYDIKSGRLAGVPAVEQLIYRLATTH